MGLRGGEGGEERGGRGEERRGGEGDTLNTLHHSNGHSMEDSVTVEKQQPKVSTPPLTHRCPAHFIAVPQERGCETVQHEHIKLLPCQSFAMQHLGRCVPVRTSVRLQGRGGAGEGKRMSDDKRF